MARLRKIQASFVTGEFDPTLQGRVDIDDYSKGADKLRNVYVRPQGGAFRREGLEYYATVNGSNPARLIEFQFNDAQTYVLLFTAGRMDVYRTDTKTLQATVTTSPISNITEDMLDEINWTQSADTLLLFHKDLQPIRITRTSHTVWTAANIAFERIPPFAFGSLTYSNPAGSVQADVTIGEVTLTGTSTSFDSSYEGQFINMPKGGRIFINTVSSATVIFGTVVVELADTASVATGNWELETGYEDVMSATRGWARSGTFHKGRLVLGGLKERPQTILMSKVGLFFNLDVGQAADDEAINITIDDDQVNVIYNVTSGRGLSILTSGGEFSIASTVNQSLTPNNVADQLGKETRHGSSRVRPVSVDGAIVFIERDDPNDPSTGRVVRQFVFNDTEQSFTAPNISIFSQHLINNPVAMAIRRSTQAQPANYLYLVNGDGTVAVLNSLREQSLLAWTQFDTEGIFEDVVVSGNKAFFIVKRNINGADVRYLEVLNSECQMDSSLVSTSGSPTTGWSGLSHLEAETVRLRGDDFILANETVSSGAVTTDEAVSELEAGLMFTARVKSLPVDVILQGQSFTGEWKNAVSVNLNLYETRNINVIANGKTSKPFFREFGDNVLDEPISLFTGWKKVYLGGIARDLQVEVTQEDPLEMNVLSMHFELRV